MNPEDLDELRELHRALEMTEQAINKIQGRFESDANLKTALKSKLIDIADRGAALYQKLDQI